MPGGTSSAALQSSAWWSRPVRAPMPPVRRTGKYYLKGNKRGVSGGLFHHLLIKAWWYRVGDLCGRRHDEKQHGKEGNTWTFSGSNTTSARKTRKTLSYSSIPRPKACL